MTDRMQDAFADLLRPGVHLMFVGTAAGQRSHVDDSTARRTETVFGPDYICDAA